MNKVRTMEELPLSGFHYKMFGYASGSTFIDGYIIGIIAVALSVMQSYFDMSLTMIGLLGMATLGGMFVGGIIGGYLTDLIGRKTMFLIDMLIMLIVSILQFFINDPMQLVILRFILGIAVGADYPIAGALMAEFSPKKKRGALLGGLNGFWYVGYAISYLVGYFLLSIGDTSWRWMLASTAIPVLLMLLARLNMPESPHWLASKGREKEANAIIQKIFGDHVIMSNEPETKVKTSFLDIFRNGYGKWVFFVSVFWSLQVIPTFGIGTYIPEILKQFGFANGTREYLGAAVINIVYLAGLLPALYLVEKYGRRPTLIFPFLVSSIALFVLGATSGLNMSFIFIVVLFIIYGTFNTAMGAHDWIYPNELFPTHIRGTAMGFITGVTRIASAIGTFFFPAILANFGLAATLYICGALFFIGFLVSLIMAPETKNMSLSESSSINKGTTRRPESILIGKAVK
ncbi:MFS transporter [Bacillus sp. ISL-40]|uniref:MFS transporter n=1 Tax=unclassified Bacillus (in: firmicutes) TaxID=185979 RepID=UPI001BE625FC|nr:MULTISPECIES: MFS transporter [unclassified Bacillus (in: firmicutes)]MBT2701360.1 MFS transporter [Bacillus sp. ISL-40]MBT2719697.1 MFS transporter [Bacillus sp. ISL-46]MBT2742138.1 MFS transporter [Bacillus sp. ISL-77]